MDNIHMQHYEEILLPLPIIRLPEDSILAFHE